MNEPFKITPKERTYFSDQPLQIYHKKTEQLDFATISNLFEILFYPNITFIEFKNIKSQTFDINMYACKLKFTSVTCIFKSSFHLESQEITNCAQLT